MKANKVNGGVNSLLPNRANFSTTLGLDVNGKWVKDIDAGRNTAKQSWSTAMCSAKEAIKIDGAKEIIVTMFLNSVCVGMVIATKSDGKVNVTSEIYESAIKYLTQNN